MTEAFPFLNSLNSLPGIRAGWIERVPDVAITCDRDQAMNLLRPYHERAVAAFTLPPMGNLPGGTAINERTTPSMDWWRAEQVLGNLVAAVPCESLISAPDGLPIVPGVDGLVTCEPGIVLSIYVADCGAIWLADSKTGAIGLLHSGKKGTETNILENALVVMGERFGTRPEDVTAVLSPCIRLPDYEVDFAGQIASQAAQAGIGNFSDCGLNTAADLSRFYSYRKELGKTGRMMALMTRDLQL